MSESVGKLQDLLRELFQFECADLDSRDIWLVNEYLGNLTFK